MIVFLSVFVTYAISGMCLFGFDVEEFATLEYAVNSCFLMLLGEFDWGSLRQVGKTEAHIWFWTYNVFVT